MTRVTALLLLVMGCGEVSQVEGGDAGPEAAECYWPDGVYRVTHRLDPMADSSCPVPAAGLVRFSDEMPGGETAGTSRDNCTGSSEMVDECTYESEDQCDIHDDISGEKLGSYERLMLLTLDEYGATAIQDMKFTMPNGETLKCLIHTVWREA